MYAGVQVAHDRHREARAIVAAVPGAVATQFEADVSAGSAQSTPRGPQGAAASVAAAPSSAQPSSGA
eukprot:6797448-Lingulodinium_polyedra.AAC.1